MAESFLEEAGLGGEEDGACDEEIEVLKYIFKLSQSEVMWDKMVAIDKKKCSRLPSPPPK